MDYHVGHDVGIYKDFSNVNTSTKGELSRIIYTMKVQTPSELKWQVQASLCVRLPRPPVVPCPPVLCIGSVEVAVSSGHSLLSTQSQECPDAGGEYPYRVDLSEWKAGFS